MFRPAVAAAAPDGRLDALVCAAGTPPSGPWDDESHWTTTIEADLTVTKLADDRFWVVASDTAHGHVQAWIRRHTGDLRVTTTDATSAFAQINVQGPASRALLQSLTSCDLSNEGFPFRAARWIDNPPSMSTSLSSLLNA